MTALGWVCLGLAIAAALAALGYALWQRHGAKRTMQTLQTMLDSAIAGNFNESRYDESMLCAVESKLAQYLGQSAQSAKMVAEEKEKIKELIADISHQTKTPLANLQLYGQLLAEQELPPQPAACVQAINTQTEKLGFLIEALVKISRLETGVFTMHPAQVPVQNLLDGALAAVHAKAAAKQITLTAAPTAATAQCDAKWTAEALYNLVDNAVKYTPAGGEVKLFTTPYELFTRIHVQDSGVGIPENEQPKIFRRFYRAPSAAQAEGVGIGLYLAREIAAGQGGYIKVESQPGKGSTFSLFLPRA